MQQQDLLATPPITVFYSYAPEDEADQQSLEKRLRLLRTQGLIEDWHRGMISGGEEAQQQINAHLETAQIILLLVSPDFLASEYHFNTEMQRACQRQANREVRVIPILLRPCEWEESPLAKLHALPANHNPISQWQDRDTAFLDVAQGIRVVVRELRNDSPPAIVTSEHQHREALASSSPRPKNYLPFPQNPLFQPRPGEFEQLETLLFAPATEQHSRRIGLVGMVGMGGVGKTQLAAQLAHRYQHRFPAGIFWMTATGTTHYDWQRHLAELATQTDYLPPDDDPSSPENESRRARHLSRYLASHPDALLILDNVEDPNLVLSALPALAGGAVTCTILYTSRNRLALPGITTHPVEQLPEETALRLLLATTRPSLLTEVLAGNQNSEAQAARTICQGVGYLPLALIHLQGLLKRDPHLTLPRLAQVLKERGALEVAKKQYLDAVPLFATFSFSWEQVHDEGTQRLFKLASYFPEATPIPLWLLGLATGLGEGGDILAPLGEACVQLQELSLLEELSDDQVRLHPLLREFGQRLVAEESDNGTALLQAAAQRLTTEFTDLNRLEQRARQHSYLGCLEQIHAASEYAELLGTAQTEQLRQVERWLDRESHLLGNEKLWPAMIPGLFYQQLYNRSVEAGHLLPGAEVPTRWVRQEGQVGAEDQSLLRIFAGHTSVVMSVAFSPDGSQVLTGSDDKTAQLWETSSGRLLRTLQGHTHCVTNVAFSPDGKLVLTSSNDYTVRLWETSSGRLLRTLQGHMGGVSSVAFSPDGSQVLTGSNDKTARLWETSSGKLLRTLEGHTHLVTSVVFAPDGRQVLTGSWDNTARLWETSSGRLLSMLQGHTGGVSSVAFSPDGSQVLTGSHDQKARLWETSSGRLLRTLKGHTGWVSSVAFSPDGGQVLTGSNDKTARLWETSSGKLLRTLGGHTHLVTSVVFAPDGRQVLTGSWDNTARLWETSSSRLLSMLQGHTGGVSSVAFFPDGSQVLTGSNDKTARLWETSSGRLLRTLQGHTDRVSSVAFSPDGGQVLTGSNDKTARLWETSSGRLLRTLEGHTREVRSVVFAPDGKQVLTGSNDRTARLWEAASGKLLSTLKGHIGEVRSVAFSPDGGQVLTGSRDQTARLWETNSGKLLSILEGHTSYVTSVTFAPDGRLVLTCDEHGWVRLWRASGAEIGSLLGLYVATYEVGAVHWEDNTHVVLADKGGARFRPHFYRLKLEGM